MNNIPRYRRGALLLGLALALLSPAGRACGSDAQDVQQVIARNAVTVWTCEIPAEPLRGFKAVTTVRSSLSGLVALLLDTAAAPEWVFRTDRIELLRRDDRAQTFTVRAETNFWPLQNRDVVINGRIAQDPVTLVVTIDSQSAPPGQYPIRDEFVRMPNMRGHWEFRPLGNGLVEVTMNGIADPGGAIPDFLVNLVIKETPYQTLLGLRRLIGQPRYQQSRIEAIREPRTGPVPGAPAVPAASPAP